jgi:hypothetical protein
MTKTEFATSIEVGEARSSVSIRQPSSTIFFNLCHLQVAVESRTNKSEQPCAWARLGD